MAIAHLLTSGTFYDQINKINEIIDYLNNDTFPSLIINPGPLLVGTTVDDGINIAQFAGGIRVDSQASFADGTAVAPSVTFTTNSRKDGMWHPAAGQIAFSANSTEIVRLNGTGIGVNTSSPQATLHVQGGGFFSGGGVSGGVGLAAEFTSGAGYLSSYNYTSAIWQPLTIRGSTINLQNNGTTALYVAGGNVGIGTTAPAFSLDVVGSGRYSGNLLVGGTLGVSSNLTTGGTLSVSGNASLNGTTTTGTLNVSGGSLNTSSSLGHNLSGEILLDRNPTVPLQAATKQYVDGAVGGTASLSPNGWAKLPSGLILQWGQFVTNTPSGGYTLGEGSYHFNFNIPFPTACLNLVPTALENTNNGTADVWAQWDVSHTTKSVGYIYLQWDGQPNNQCDGYAWFAVGY